MEPVSSNSQAKTCGETMNSGCVIWSGPDIPNISICKGASITDVIYGLSTNCCASSSTCYSGNWIDFSSSIPTSGTGLGGLTWTIGTFGIGGMYPPQYKWTKDGDLLVRGSLVFTHTPSATGDQFINIPLTTISSSCISNVTKNQYVIVDVHVSTIQKLIANHIVCRLILRTSGVLELELELNSPIPSGNTYGITLGGTKFNIV
jgi:hypothetical protein